MRHTRQTTEYHREVLGKDIRVSDDSSDEMKAGDGAEDVRTVV